MDKLLKQMKEEWERMTPEQKKWEAERLKEWDKEIEEFQKTPLTEVKKYIAWMDSVEDGSYLTEKDKKRIRELADSI